MKSTTVALIAVAVLLGGVVYVLEARNGSQSETVESQQGQQIFSFSEGDVQALTVETQLRTLRFERDAEGQWQMLEPETGLANPASVAFLLNLLATGRSDRILTVSAGDRESFGLHQPLATVAVTLENQETHQFVLGGYDFNRRFLYALADPSGDGGAVAAGEGTEAGEGAEEMEVLLVSPNFENAVSRSLDEWKLTESLDNSSDPESNPPESDAPEPTAPALPETSEDSAGEGTESVENSGEPASGAIPSPTVPADSN